MNKLFNLSRNISERIDKLKRTHNVAKLTNNGKKNKRGPNFFLHNSGHKTSGKVKLFKFFRLHGRELFL